MPPLAAEALMLVPAYLLGGIPFSLIVGKVFYRTDLRMRGSGNLGATNTFRELGATAGIAVLLLDAAKGAAAVLVAERGVSLLTAPASPDLSAYLIVVTFAVIAGHDYSPYLRLHGGKGVAAAAGALFTIMPAVTGILAVVFAVVVATTRWVSLGSVVVAALFPPLVYGLYSQQPAAVVLATLAAALVVWRHRSNISRIIKGTEPRLTLKRRTEDSP